MRCGLLDGGDGGDDGGRTVKPLNGADVPPGVVIVSVRDPRGRGSPTVTKSDSEVAVPPGWIVATIPNPSNLAAVAPDRFVPVTVIVKLVLATAVCGVIAVISGRGDTGAGSTVKPQNGSDQSVNAVLILSPLCPGPASAGTVTNSDSEVAVRAGAIVALTSPA